MTQIISAIDIGSNSIRMTIGERINNGPIRILEKWRDPIRLGKDVFLSGFIEFSNFKAVAQSLQRFSEFNQKYNVNQYRAIATSALREAKNQKEFINYIFQETGIHIDIIDGLEEARLIHKAVSRKLILSSQNVLLIDVGGGSVEISYSEKMNTIISKSFPMGTVRILELLKMKGLPEKSLKTAIHENYYSMITHFFSISLPNHKSDCLIGTGGNLEYLEILKIQMLNNPINSEVTIKELSTIIAKLSQMSIPKRIQELKIKPDRADVVLPALEVVELVMRVAKVEKLLIPKVGLQDGVLLELLD